MGRREGGELDEEGKKREGGDIDSQSAKGARKGGGGSGLILRATALARRSRFASGEGREGRGEGEHILTCSSVCRMTEPPPPTSKVRPLRNLCRASGIDGAQS